MCSFGEVTDFNFEIIYIYNMLSNTHKGVLKIVNNHDTVYILYIIYIDYTDI